MVFLVALFLIRDTSVFKKSLNTVLGKKETGLAYDMTVGEFVYKDADGDGVPDWEESLYGLDPTKKETTPGIPDSTAMNKLKANQLEANSLNSQGTENLTETDKFSRELFSTTATLNQNGAMDQNTANQLGSSLASKIQNTPTRKIFLLSDIKVINDNNIKAVINYSDTLNNIQQKYPNKGNVLDILQKFVIDENNVNSSVLIELDPIIKQTQGTINEITKMSVPQFLASAHLDFLNALERLLENISDIRLYDSDVIVALGGISKYQDNASLLESADKNLINIINDKLNN